MTLIFEFSFCFESRVNSVVSTFVCFVLPVVVVPCSSCCLLLLRERSFVFVIFIY